MYILHVYRNVNWSLWGECEWDRIRTKDSLRELIRESIIVINFKNYVLSNLLFVIKTILSRVIIIIIIFLEEINDAARVYTCNTFNLLWVDLLRPRGNGTVFPKIQSLWLGNARNGGEKACTKYDWKRSRFSARETVPGKLTILSRLDTWSMSNSRI